jgi:hypothetical protein
MTLTKSPGMPITRLQPLSFGKMGFRYVITSPTWIFRPRRWSDE